MIFWGRQNIAGESSLKIPYGTIAVNCIYTVYIHVYKFLVYSVYIPVYFFDSIHIQVYITYIVSHIFVYTLEKFPQKIAKFVHQIVIFAYIK